MGLQLFLDLISHSNEFWVVHQSKFGHAWHDVSMIDSDRKEDLVIRFSLLDHHELFLNGGGVLFAFRDGVHGPNLVCNLVLFVKSVPF